jgi:predicted RNase H-like nuclease (RuvC/YqgF family)
MKIPTQDLCERLSHVEGMRRIGPLIAEARTTIEAQAAHIQKQALEYISLFDQCSEAQDRVKELEAKCALLAQSLEQEKTRSAALKAGLTDGVTDDMAVLQSRIEELEAQLRERGERVSALETYLQAWEKVEPMSWFYFEDGKFIRMYDSEEKAEAAREKFGGDVTPVYERPPVDAQIARPPAAAASEDKRDAERYRWLLSMSWGLPVGDRGAFEWRMPGFTCCAKEPRKAFDERIDAGIAAQKERGE